MGGLMDLYVGDAEAIGRAFTRSDFATLEDPDSVLAHVDLSLHLSLVDFDTLTAAASGFVGSGPLSFMDSLGRSVGGDQEECDANVVDPRWVEVLAGVPDSKVSELSRAWWTAVRAEMASIPANKGRIPNDMGPTPPSDVEEAVRGIVAACRMARERKASVVFAWSV